MRPQPEIVNQVVDFLTRENALRPGGSPWPTLSQSDDAHHLDWDRLFPKTRASRDGPHEWDVFGDDWSPEFDADFLGEIEEALARGKPKQTDQTAGGPGVESGARWDICAWYQPLHFFGLNWGIFIREDCSRRLAVRIAHEMPRIMLGGATVARLAKAMVRAATYAYFLHEHFHHKVECLGLRLHVVDRTSRYLPYHSMVYRTTSGTDRQLEESLANADMWRRLNTQPYLRWISRPVLRALREYLRRSFPADPPGYRRAVDFLTPRRFADGENLLQGQVKEATTRPAQPSADWHIAPRLLQSFLPVTSDIKTVVRRGQPSTLPTFPLLTGTSPRPG